MTTANLWVSPISYLAGPTSSYHLPECSGDVLSANSSWCFLGWSGTSLDFNFCWHHIYCIPTSCHFGDFMRYFLTVLFRLNTTSGSLNLWLHNFKRFSMRPFLWMSLLSSYPTLSKGFALEGHWEYSSLIYLLAAIHLVENHSVVYWPLLVSATLYLSVHKTLIIQGSYQTLPLLTQYKNFLHYLCHFHWHITPNFMSRHFCFLQWSIWRFQYRMIKEGQMGACTDTHAHKYI